MELKTSIGIRGNSRVVLDDSEKDVSENILETLFFNLKKQ